MEGALKPKGYFLLFSFFFSLLRVLVCSQSVSAGYEIKKDKRKEASLKC